MENILTRTLTIAEQREVLGGLFGFTVDDDGVIFNEDGEDFYQFDNNLKFELKNLKGIIESQKIFSFEKGKIHQQLEIQKALGL